jgi:hypothetical protein
MTDRDTAEDTPTGTVLRTDAGYAVLPAVLGWGNPERDRESCRLYSLDAGPGPRWLEPPAGRVVEQGIREAGVTPYPSGQGEGDRYLIVRVGSRFVSEEAVARAAERILAVLEEIDPDGRR